MYRVNQKLRPAAAQAAAREPVQKHKYRYTDVT